MVTDGLRESDGRSALDFLWLPDARLPGEPSHHIKIRSTISVAWDFTTKSGGIWIFFMRFLIVCGGESAQSTSVRIPPGILALLGPASNVMCHAIDRTR